MQIKDLIPVSNVNLIFLRQIVYSDFFYFFFYFANTKKCWQKKYTRYIFSCVIFSVYLEAIVMIEVESA